MDTLGGRFNSRGYGNWKFDASELRKRAMGLAEKLPALMQVYNADFIAVRGTSGTFMVGALQMLTDVPVLLMRKRGEESHGCEIEGTTEHLYQRGIIVDDFVDTGATVEGMIEDAEGKFIQFKAVVEHEKAASWRSIEEKGFTVGGLPVYTFN